MNRQEIEEIVPHREGMLLIDEVELTDETHAVGRCAVRGNEWFLRGHYPNEPIVPGVILCEMIAQTCCVIIMKKTSTATPYFAGMKKVRFISKVTPGDTLRFDCTLTGKRHPFYFVEGSGSVDGRVCVTGEFSFAVIGEL